MPVADLPPGLDPDELAAVPTTSARRGRLRKRIAFLRAARELLLRDLGGFVYELHRTAHDHEHQAHRQLRATKLDRLTRIDAELHELELLLDDVRRNVVVSEPGVGGECPECGELFGSAAHYCSHCGLPLTESARRAFSRIVAAQPVPAPVAPTDQATQELPPLPAQAGTEFHWPPRDAAPESGAGMPGEAAARGDVAPAGGDVAAASGATASGDAAATSGDATPASDDAAAGGDEPAPRGDASPASDDATAPSGATASADEPATRSDATPPSDVPAATGGATASGDATGDAAASSGDDPATRGDASPARDDATAPGQPADDAENGRQPGGDLFSRVERGT